MEGFDQQVVKCMNRKTVKRIFIGTGLFLILQYTIVGVVGYIHSEPWPAFIFPGFRSVLVFDDGFEVSRFEFHFPAADSDTTVVTPQQLFSELPDSQLPGFLRTRFGQHEKNLAFSNESRLWLKEQAVRATGVMPEQMMVVQFREFYSHHNQRATLDSMVVDNIVTIDLKGE